MIIVKLNLEIVTSLINELHIYIRRPLKRRFFYVYKFEAFCHSILVLQAGEEEKDDLKIQIETAIAALNDPQSPMSI